MKWKTWERALAVALALTVGLGCTSLNAASEDIPARVLRLHVLANSDSQADQALKLKVRDRILQVSSGWMSAAKTREEAEAAAQAHLPQLQKEAEAVLRENGSQYTVRVTLEDTYFPTRQYETVTLPAGVYRALRVVIGKGAGHNWWCVLFPALCLPSAQPEQDISDVLTPTETKLVTGHYQIKFKSVELWEQFRAWCRSIGK
jgi:stage II sporulation protein R